MIDAARPRALPAAVLAAAAAALLAACGPRVPPPDLSLDPAELLGQVRAAQARPRTVRGEARLSVKSSTGSGTVTELVAAERPDRLRLETLDFFGNPAAVLASADGRFSLWDGRERVFYRGEATAENLARLLPLPMAAPELAAILCGTVDLPEAARALAAAPGRGFVTLDLEAGGRPLRLRVGPGARIERAERGGPGGYRLEFSGFEAVAGAASFPGAIALSSDDPKVKVDLTWKDVEADAALEPAQFTLTPPRGARVVELGNGEAPRGFQGLTPGAAP